MSEALVKVPKAPLGISRARLALTFLVPSSIMVGLGQITSSLGLVGVGSSFLMLGWFVFRQRREIQRFNRESAAALARLAHGDLAAARECFWRWAETTRSPNVAAVARLNLGWTLIFQAELDQAIAVLTDSVDRYATELRAQKVLHRNHIANALAYALRGDCDAAETCLDKALAARGSQEMLHGVYVAAIIEIRRGNAESAAKVLEDSWVKLESTLTGMDLRPIRVVRGFALAAAGVRAAGTASAALAGIRPMFPGEYHFLGVAWPEMAAFVASHDLAG